MARFGNILVAIDPDRDAQPALEHAVDLARRSGGALKLIRVLESPSRRERLAQPSLEQFRAAFEQGERRALERAAASLRERRLEPSWKLLAGRPEVEISFEVVRGGHDLVVVPGRGRGGNSALDAVAVRLMRICPSAVLVVKPGHRPPFRRIVAAVDPEPLDEVKADLNRRTVETALELSHEEDAECLVVHAWAPLDEVRLRLHLGDHAFEEYESALRDAADTALRETLAPYRSQLPDGAVLLRRGPPREVISDLVKRREVDLVVMGTVARRGLQGLMIGNTSEIVLGRTSCSVLSLKPEGFRSPVCV